MQFFIIFFLLGIIIYNIFIMCVNKIMAQGEQFHGAEPVLELLDVVLYIEEEDLGPGLLRISEK